MGKTSLEDLREEFVRDFVFPALRADAAYEQDYLLGTSLARPLIAKAQMEVVRKENADAVALRLSESDMALLDELTSPRAQSILETTGESAACDARSTF